MLTTAKPYSGRGGLPLYTNNNLEIFGSAPFNSAALKKYTIHYTMRHRNIHLKQPNTPLE